MGKHTQTIRRFLLTNCLSVFDHFVELPLKGLSFQEGKPKGKENYKPVCVLSIISELFEKIRSVIKQNQHYANTD